MQLTQLKDESQREKDSMVMKYAQAEQRNIELQEKLQKAETATKDSTAEKENLTTYLNSLRADKQKLKDLLEKRVCYLCRSLNSLDVLTRPNCLLFWVSKVRISRSYLDLVSQVLVGTWRPDFSIVG